MEEIACILNKYSAQNPTNTKEKKSNIETDKFTSKVSNESAIKDLTQKYNVSISVKSVSNNENAVWGEAYNYRNNYSSGFQMPVIIAPNVLNSMAVDPKKKEYVEKVIKNEYVENKKLESMVAMTGDRIISRGIVFHEDGTWTSWAECEPSPEKVRKCEAEQKEKEKEEKKHKLQKKLYYKNGDANIYTVLDNKLMTEAPLDIQIINNRINISSDELNKFKTSKGRKNTYVKGNPII